MEDEIRCLNSFAKSTYLSCHFTRHKRLLAHILSFGTMKLFPMTAFKGALSTVLQNNRPVTKRPKLYSIRAPRHCKLQALLENIAPSKIQALPHCLTRSDVTSVERGVHMSQCGQASLGMRIEGVGDSHFS